jgi:hypothetical protein
MPSLSATSAVRAQPSPRAGAPRIVQLRPNTQTTSTDRPLRPGHRAGRRAQRRLEHRHANQKALARPNRRRRPRGHKPSIAAGRRHLLMDILKQTAAGHAVTFVLLEAEITTREPSALGQEPDLAWAEHLRWSLAGAPSCLSGIQWSLRMTEKPARISLNSTATGCRNDGRFGRASTCL